MAMEGALMVGEKASGSGDLVEDLGVCFAPGKRGALAARPSKPTAYSAAYFAKATKARQATKARKDRRSLEAVAIFYLPSSISRRLR
jgi:hypothetical protein